MLGAPGADATLQGAAQGDPSRDRDDVVAFLPGASPAGRRNGWQAAAECRSPTARPVGRRPDAAMVARQLSGRCSRGSASIRRPHGRSRRSWRRRRVADGGSGVPCTVSSAGRWRGVRANQTSFSSRGSDPAHTHAATRGPGKTPRPPVWPDYGCATPTRRPTKPDNLRVADRPTLLSRGKLPGKSATRLLESQLAPYVDALGNYLIERRYASSTVDGYLACIAEFGLWMNLSLLNIDGINDDVVQRFLDSHLVGCSNSVAGRSKYCNLRASLRHLLVVLRANSVIAGALSCNDPGGRGVASLR